METGRIEISRFDNFNRCTIDGNEYMSIRWHSAMESIDEMIARKNKERIAMNQAAGYGPVAQVCKG